MRSYNVFFNLRESTSAIDLPRRRGVGRGVSEAPREPMDAAHEPLGMGSRPVPMSLAGLVTSNNPGLECQPFGNTDLIGPIGVEHLCDLRLRIDPHPKLDPL